MIVPFVGGAYTARSSNLNAQECINLFPVVDKRDAKAVVSLQRTPGLELFSAVSSDLPCRMLYQVNDRIYTVFGNKLFVVSLVGTATELAAINSVSGYISVADNSFELMFVDGTEFSYIVNVSSNVVTVLDSSDGIPIFCSVTFQDGYFIAVEKNTRRFYISALFNGKSWDALDVTTVEGRAGNLVATISNVQDLWLFGERVIEVYYNSGNATFPFERIAGALIDIGCAAVGSPMKIGGSLFWLTSNGQVCVNNGYTGSTPVSTPEIDYQISTYSRIDDAISYYYSMDGHHFYVLVFPTAQKTWVFDVSTDYWHEWQSYLTDGETWGRHRANCGTQVGTDWVVGDYSNGNLYKLRMNVYSDNGYAIRVRRATPVIYNERKSLIHHRLDVDFECGVGLSEALQGTDANVVLDWSDDGGHSWSNEHWSSLGKIGEYTYRSSWRRLGKSRNRVYRITIGDPIKVSVMGAYETIEVCES